MRLLFIVLVLLPVIASGQQSVGIAPAPSSQKDDAPAARIDARIRAILQEHALPGASVAVFDHGQVVWAQGYGVADVTTGAQVDTGTLFQAGSISKAVSATLLMRLVELGTLALDEDVNTKLTSWKVPSNRFTAVAPVTLRLIAMHRSGLSQPGFIGYPPRLPLPTLPQILDGLAPSNSQRVRVDTTPGAAFFYSGGGYEVMQQVMMDVTGKAFAALAHDLVLEPIGMQQSTFEQPLPEVLRSRAATGYGKDSVAVYGRYFTYPEQAAAGLWSTPSDIARFMIAISQSYHGAPHAVLTRSSAHTMLTAVAKQYGMSFTVHADSSCTYYSHSGATQGFRSYTIASTDGARGIVLMVNSDYGNALIDPVVAAIEREYGWGIWPFP